MIILTLYLIVLLLIKVFCYFNMQKLLGKLKLARVDGTIIKLVANISRVDLLIIDDFGMKALKGQQQNDFMARCIPLPAPVYGSK